MEKNQPEETKSELVAKFKIVCLKCDKEDKKHDTLLYVQWEKRYYMITCHNCDSTEAFDEMAKKIEIKEEDVEAETQNN